MRQTGRFNLRSAISSNAVTLLLLGSTIIDAQQSRFELPADQRTGSIRRIFILPHSHLDIGFTLPPDQVARDYKDSIDLAIRLAKEHDDFRWTIESTWMLGEWLRRTSDSAAIAELAKLMRERKISLGATFGNMHSGLMDTEEMNRLVYLGEAFRRRFGIQAEVAYQNDVPGFSWAYPRVLRGSGVKYLITGLNLFIGGGNNLGVANTPFYWIGPDGSRVLTWFTYDSYVEGYRWKIGSNAPFEEMEQTVFRRLAWLERQGYPYDSLLVMDAVGDNGDPSTAYRTLQRIRNWNRRHPELPMKPCIAEEFFEDLIAKHGTKFHQAQGDAAGHWELVKLGAPEVSGRLRETASLLPAAESLATIVSLLSKAAYPTFDLADAWRELLTYHEHTAGAGPGWPGYFSRWQTDWNNAAHYAAAMSGYSNTRQLFDKAVHRLAGATGLQDPAHHSTGAEITVLVYNGLSWARRGPVTVSGLPKEMREGSLEIRDLATGQTSPVQEVPGTNRIVEFFAPSIPAIGYRAFALRKSAAESRNAPESPIVVTVNAEGHLQSIRESRTGAEMIATNSALKFGRIYASNSKGGYDETAAGPAETRAVAGPVSRQLDIARREGALLKTSIKTYPNAAYVDLAFSTKLPALNDRSVRYAVALPFAGKKNEFAFDGPGMIVRFPQDLLPGGGAAQVAPLHFVHYSGDGGRGITLANRDAFLFRPDGLFLLGSESLTTETREEGKQRLFRTEPRGSEVLTFRFRASLQGDDPVEWKRLGEELNLPLQAVVIPDRNLPAERSFLAAEPANIQITAFKRSEFEPGSCVLRLQEIAGRATPGAQLSTTLSLTNARMTNLVETPTGAAANLQKLDFQPFQTITILARCGS